VAGLSRRAFLATVGALSAAWAIPRQALGSALAADLTPSEAPSTIQQTIRIGPVQSRSYRTLSTGPGELHYPRLDLTGQLPDPARVDRRRSLLYLGHLTDIHIMDAQSPARLEPLIAMDHELWAGAFRPQDTLTTQVAASMVEAMSALHTSPVTGAPMAAAFITGDSTDMMSYLELRWYIDVVDGASITPNSGLPGVYEGVQAWPESAYAYQPDNPGTGDWAAYGFPQIPGMLEAAVGQEVRSPGLPVPWYTVYGNHDTLYLGTLAVPTGLRAFAVGDRKYWDWRALTLDYVQDWAAETSPLMTAIRAFTDNVGVHLGAKSVASDPRRKLFEQQDFMREHFVTSANPGPVGHGFTQGNLDSGRTYWAADVGPFTRVFGLDTCNQVAGPDGALPGEQYDWLEAQLAQAQADGRLAIVLSHHNSFTMDNPAELATGPQRLVHGDEFIAMLLRYPNLVAWVNGHTHINTITPHRRADDSGGFWEITAASCIDYPQQQQVVEIVDNRDGTLSLFTTAVDHAGPAEWDGDLTPIGLASLSRQLSANDWVETPSMRIGSELDRNTELLLPAPFDLSRFTDAQVEAAQAEARARILSYEGGWPS
jgi:metallophosphoesterase (TIGR03767 family)